MKYFFGLCLILLPALAFAQANAPINAAEMQALIGKGIAVTSMDIEGGKKYTGRVNLEAGGRLTGSLDVVGHGAVPLNGSWKLQGAQVCRTLGEVQPELVCETWVRTGPRQVTVRVGNKDVSINRW